MVVVVVVFRMRLKIDKFISRFVFEAWKFWNVIIEVNKWRTNYEDRNMRVSL